ncbi:MAG: hypothetical protein ACFE0P_06245 [Oceanicaulis sp.]
MALRLTRRLRLELIVLVVLVFAAAILDRAPWRAETCGEVEAVVAGEARAYVSATGRRPMGRLAQTIETADGRLYAMRGAAPLEPGVRVRAVLICEAGGPPRRPRFLERIEG